MAATDLDASELAYLLERLGQSVDQMRGRMRGRTLAMVGLCVAGGAAAVTTAGSRLTVEADD